MGHALANAAVRAGHAVVVVSGPVDFAYPSEAIVVPVVSTEDMLAACQEAFPSCDGLVAVAAPCDYRPVRVAPHKIAKTGGPLRLELVETPDIVASLAAVRERQWIVAFALETHDRHLRAMQKMERKSCDLIVVNGPAAIHATHTFVEVLERGGHVVAELSGDKPQVAEALFSIIAERLIAAAKA